jgi:hypothetical protein
MPIHDWTRVPSGLFHDFHQSWAIRIKDALNADLLPNGTIALVEQRSLGREGDVVAIEAPATSRRDDFELEEGGIAIQAPPKTQIVCRSNKAFYAEAANRIVIRHHLGRIIAVIEIVSPGNKSTQSALRNFVEKTVDFLHEGIHVLVIDLFPPTPRDTQGIHKAIWDELDDTPFELPAGKDRVAVSYQAGSDLIAYVEPVTLGDRLPAMPLFLTGGRRKSVHVQVPLEATYQATWDATPAELRRAVETGIFPDVNSS